VSIGWGKRGGRSGGSESTKGVSIGKKKRKHHTLVKGRSGRLFGPVEVREKGMDKRGGEKK